MIGAGKYDDALRVARSQCEASAGLLLLFDGKDGPGFSCHADLKMIVRLPAMLRFMADEIEADLKKGKL